MNSASIKIKKSRPVLRKSGIVILNNNREIIKFEWQIGTPTTTGTTTEFTFDENGEYQVTLTVTDNDGVTSSTSTTIKVEPFSFAIITDLHIDRGYPDYGSEGFDDEDNGEEYYLTQRLRNVISWINKHKENYSFKFVAVLGDIADTAEKSEFCKAKEILDELEIPYIPVFGNHDVWPYTEKESASGPLGEDFFERIFWSTTSIPCENASSTRNFEILLRDFNFERDAQNPKFKNFAFNFGGIYFIGLDFNSREKEEKWYLGPTGAKGEAVNHRETIEWLKKKLDELGGKDSVIIFSHEPFAKPKSRSYYNVLGKEIFLFPREMGNFSKEGLEDVKQILEDYEDKFEGQQILANFGGHIHGFEKFGKEIKFFGQFSPIDLYFDANWQYPSLSTVPVLTTEALMVGGNEKDLSNKGLVRIVKIEEKEKIDFSEIEFKEPALNPYITFEFKSKIVGNFIYPCLIFVPQTFTKREIDYFLWDFGDGKTERTSPLIWEGKVIHCYSPSNLPATYNVTLIAVDKETNKSEYITKKVEIREGIIPKIIKIGEDLKDKVELISMELNEKVTEFGRTMRDWVWIKVKHSPSTPVGLINVHFEEATEDIDLSQLKTDIDFQKKKSLLYMPQWPEVVEKEKILFIPK
jgi:PKD repeat protein